MSLEGRTRRGGVSSSDALFPCLVPAPSTHLLHPSPFPLSVLPRLLLLCVHFISLLYIRSYLISGYYLYWYPFVRVSFLCFLLLLLHAQTRHTTGSFFPPYSIVSLAYIRIPSLEPSLFTPLSLISPSSAQGIVQSNSLWDLFSFLPPPLSLSPLYRHSSFHIFFSPLCVFVCPTI